MCYHLTFRKLSHAERLRVFRTKTLPLTLHSKGFLRTKSTLNYKRTAFICRDLSMFSGANVSVAVRLKAFFSVYSNDLVIVF